MFYIYKNAEIKTKKSPTNNKQTLKYEKHESERWNTYSCGYNLRVYKLRYITFRFTADEKKKKKTCVNITFKLLVLEVLLTQFFKIYQCLSFVLQNVFFFF